jgi:hypothetical protein
MDAASTLLAASALHAGFQLVVTVVVYPALVDTPSRSWGAVHAAHSRRMTVVVTPVYLAVAVACLWVLLAGPYRLPLVVAVAGHASAALSTAVVAAPAHGRLGREGTTPRLLRRLLLADRVRLVAAAIALGAAFAA